VKFLSGLVIGALIGAGIAVAIAPRAGSELQNTLDELIERGKNILDQAVDEGRRAADDQRETLEKQAAS